MSSLRGDALAGPAPASGFRLVAPGAPAAGHRRFRPVFALRVAVVLMLIGQLGRIPVLPVGATEAPILVNDLCVIAVLMAGGLSALYARSLRIDLVAGIALLFAGLGGIMALAAVPRFGLTGMELVVSLAFLARWLVYFGLYVVVINIVKSDDVMDVWHTLEAMMLALAAFGIVQAIFLPHFAQLVYPDSRVGIDWDDQSHRLVSTMLEPNIAGSMLMLVLVVQLAQLSTGEQVPLWKPTVIFAALLGTLSRSSFLGLLVGGAIVLVVRGVSRRMLRFATLLLLLLVPVVPRVLEFARQFNKLSVVDPSAMSRVAAWLRLLNVFSDNMVFGIGFNTYRYVQARYGYSLLSGISASSSDGGLLFIAVMTGLVGLALYLGMLWLVVLKCRAIWTNPRAGRGQQALATGIAAGTVAVCVHSLFVNSLLTTFVMEPLWILWGLAYVMARSLSPAAAESPPARIVACRTAS